MYPPDLCQRSSQRAQRPGLGAPMLLPMLAGCMRQAQRLNRCRRAGALVGGGLRAPFLLLAALLLTGSASAQMRERSTGRVLSQDGTPWANARVELVSRPIAGDDRFGSADLLQTQSDADGRIGLPLLTGRSYLGWAHVELPDGRYLASFTAADVCAGQPFELRADAVRPHARVRIEGLDPWRSLGPIRCTLLVRDGTLLTVPCVERDGLVVLPAVPCRRAALEILCGQQPLLRWPEEVDLGSAGVASVLVLPPRAVRFRCIDTAGNPVAGTAFVATDAEGRGAQAALAVSDVDGLLTVRLPLARMFDNVRFPARVWAAGYVPQSIVPSLDLRGGEAPPTAVQEVMLEAGSLLLGSVTIGDEPLAGLELQLLTCMRSIGRGGMRRDHLQVALRTDAAASFEATIEPGTPAWVAALLPERVWKQLPQPHGYRPSPMALIATAARLTQRQFDCNVDLAKLLTLDLQAFGSDRMPCQKAHIAILPRGPDPLVVLAGVADRQAGVRFLVPKALEFTICAWNDTAATVVLAHSDLIDEPLRLQLEERPRLHGRVVDQAGSPLPFAELEWDLTPDGAGAGAAFCACLGGHLRVRADATGSFAVTMYPGLDYDLARVNTAFGACRPGLPGIDADAELPHELLVQVPQRL